MIKKKAIFICQITEDALKLVKCQLYPKSRRQFTGVELLLLSGASDNKKIAENLSRIFKKLEYRNNPVILSLPRSLVTLRYLKVPSQSPQEIEKIVSLQSQHYLPYPAVELITGFQIISTDKEGYSHINIIVVHRDVVKRYIDILKETKISQFQILLSSYGLGNLYRYLKGQRQGAVMVADINLQQAELAIISDSGLVFSRAFKFSKTNPDWVKIFISEISKTRDAYLKEISKEAPVGFVVLARESAFGELAVALKSQIGLAAEFLDYAKGVNFSGNLSDTLGSLESSFASLLGLGLGDTPESLNLIPPDIKEAQRKACRRKEYLRSALLLAGTILAFTFSVSKNLDNKAKYLAKYKAELQKITKEAKPLEDMERRLKLLEERSEKRLSGLDVLYELNKAMPSKVTLVDLNYEEDGQIVLRGESSDLDSVFAYVSGLEKSILFKNFSAKVRYATKKKSPSGEIVDFEIICFKK